MSALADKLKEAKGCGVFKLINSPEDILREANRANLLVCRFDFADTKGKADFLSTIAKALNFPDWFGYNWDALEDCMTDLSWLDARGYVLLFENIRPFAESHPADFATALEVCNAVAEHWRNAATPLWVFIQGQQDWQPGLRRFQET